MENPVIIFGAGALGRLALEIFVANQIVVYGFLDDDASLHGKEFDNVPVLGATDDEKYLKLIGKKCEAFVATDDMALRRSLTGFLIERRKIMPCNALHPTASIAASAIIANGTLFGPNAVVSAGANVGNHCMLHAGALVDYEATLGDLVQVRAGAIIGNGATIGAEAFIGQGAIIVPGIKIGRGARVGAGSVVVQDVPDKQTVFGNPAVKV
jgi:sugar O-acyltransferase (sialic acid O-acetyltransferase NeuD family)